MRHQLAQDSARRTSRTIGSCWRRILIPFLVSTAAAHGRIEVNVTQIGFPTLRSGDVVRHGSWSPIIVDLALVGETEFDGTVRVAQYDNDGDRCFDEMDVHLRAESGGSQRVFLYMLTNQTRGHREPGVELFDEAGEAVEVVCQGELTYRAEPPQAPSVISDDDILILSVSQGAVGRVRDLVESEGTASPFRRGLHVAHTSPTGLSPHWIGLEAVDYIVWEDARPETLSDGQRAALLTWVRQGGTLLIAASRSAASLAMTEPLGGILPVDVGDVVSVDDLDVRYALIGPFKEEEDPTAGFPSPVPVVQVTLRDGARPVVNDRGEGSPYVSRSALGRGWVVFSAITLKDLFSGPGGAVDFFRNVFQLRTLGSAEEGPPTPISLFGSVVGAVSFARSAGLYLLIVGIASIAYVLVATFGSWSFLKVRLWTHHSWSVFALLALVTSFVTVMAVQSMRGFGERLHQLSVIDLDAGARFGDATVLFGLRTASDKRLDVWLPSDPLRAEKPGATECFLRPLPGSNELAGGRSSFTDPSEYRLVPAGAVVGDARIRATLKLFEGRWSGPLNGTVRGRVRIRDKRITEDSHIINELGVDLHGCVLLQPTASSGRIAVTGIGDVLCYEIGTIPADGSVINLVSRCYGPADEETIPELIADSTLRKRQTEWNRGLRSILARAGLDPMGEMTGTVGQEYSALLLLSTVTEFDPDIMNERSSAWLGRRTWSRDRLRRLDLAGQLTPDSVFLIGMADDPGPVRLFRREGEGAYRELAPDPDKSRTVYRIRIPTGIAGAEVQQPRPSAEKERIEPRER